MSVYSNKAFKELQKKWYKELKDQGFSDCEDFRGNLKQKDISTIAWKNRDIIFEFFNTLGHYLHDESIVIPDLERKVLEQWVDGVYLVDIAQNLKISNSYVDKIVAKYKPIVLSYE